MSQAQQPQLPSVGQTPTEQRTLRGLDDLVRTLIRSGVFLARATVERLVIARSGQPDLGESLKWGVLNRAATPFALKLALPQIDAKWIGVPLYFIKTDFDLSTQVTIFPTGRSINNQATPLVNNSGTYVAQEARLYTFMTDGQNWYAK